jgi:uncharacterized membrane protein YhaH (DUF805 family)
MRFLKNLFKERINRRNYIFGLISSVLLFCLVWLVLLAAYFILAVITGYFGSDEQPVYMIFIWIFLFFPIFIVCAFNISLHVRRLHDLNRSGWFWLLLLLPYVNILFLVLLLFARGTKGENHYGVEPSHSIRYPADILHLA